jgi:hypothetical protein
MFDRLFGKKADPAPAATALPSPLGLRLGCAVRLDPLLSRTLNDGRLLELPEPGTPLVAMAQGLVDLGEGVKLHRFYLDDDWWLQVKATGGLSQDGEEGIDEIELFGFGDVLVPSTQAEFDEAARNIGRPEYRYADADFKRLWGTGDGQVATSDYRESVRTKDGEAYRTRHQDMLHAREIPGSARGELLLVSVETDEEDSVSVVHSVGMLLHRSDLEIT